MQNNESASEVSGPGLNDMPVEILSMICVEISKGNPDGIIMVMRTCRLLREICLSHSSICAAAALYASTIEFARFLLHRAKGTPLFLDFDLLWTRKSMHVRDRARLTIELIRDKNPLCSARHIKNLVYKTYSEVDWISILGRFITFRNLQRLDIFLNGNCPYLPSIEAPNLEHLFLAGHHNTMPASALACFLKNMQSLRELRLDTIICEPVTNVDTAHLPCLTNIVIEGIWASTFQPIFSAISGWRTEPILSLQMHDCLPLHEVWNRSNLQTEDDLELIITPFFGMGVNIAVRKRGTTVITGVDGNSLTCGDGYVHKCYHWDRQDTDLVADVACYAHAIRSVILDAAPCLPTAYTPAGRGNSDWSEEDVQTAQKVVTLLKSLVHPHQLSVNTMKWYTIRWAKQWLWQSVRFITICCRPYTNSAWRQDQGAVNAMCQSLKLRGMGHRTQVKLVGRKWSPDIDLVELHSICTDVVDERSDF